MTAKLLVIGPSFGDANFVIIAVRENCPAMKEKQDWHSPVYSGRLEYIHSRYPSRCIDALWGHWNFRFKFVMPQTGNTHETYLIYPMIAISGTPGLSITFATLSVCRSFEAKDY